MAMKNVISLKFNDGEITFGEDDNGFVRMSKPWIGHFEFVTDLAVKALYEEVIRLKQLTGECT